MISHEWWREREARSRCGTYDHCADERMLEHPAHSNVRDADVAVAVGDAPQDVQQGLEQVPGPPRLEDDVQVLHPRHENAGHSGTDKQGHYLALRRVEAPGVELGFGLAEPVVGEKAATLTDSAP